jgi:hypothetical protein
MSDAILLKNPTSINQARTKIFNWFSDLSTPPKNIIENRAISANYLKESTDVVSFKSKWQKLLIKKKLNELQILSYLNLPNNWNGNDAKAISKNIVDKAIGLLINIDHQPEIFPTGRNTIQFEYENSDNYLEIEIFDDIMVIYKNIDNHEKEIQTNDPEIIYQEITAYYASINSK